MWYDTWIERDKVPDWLLRRGIRNLLKQRLREEDKGDPEAQQAHLSSLIRELKASPIAVNTADANQQHYEVPTAFYQYCLGKHLKYSCGYWKAGVHELDLAEADMLELTCQRAELRDGQKVLELGCGWGSLSLFMAARYPRSHFTVVSNSRTQKIYIDSRILERGLTNLVVITADMNVFGPEHLSGGGPEAAGQGESIRQQADKSRIAPGREWEAVKPGEDVERVRSGEAGTAAMPLEAGKPVEAAKPEEDAEPVKCKDLEAVKTEDVGEKISGGGFDRVVSVEMLEHMRNYQLLLKKIAGFLKPEGKLFVHIFTHKEYTYLFEPGGPGDWMSRYFFTGGIMPSDDLLLYFNDDLAVEKHWQVSGTHYGKTAEAWLVNMDRHRAEIFPLFESTYGREHAEKWWVWWRLFYMACAELWNYRGGKEWMVSHYLFHKTKG